MNKPETITSLRELDEALGELQGLFSRVDRESRMALERLRDDEGDLNSLGDLVKDWLTTVDVFHSLGLDDKEEFHSNFLAWLLSPAASHGLGSYFLREFLNFRGWRGAIPASLIDRTTVVREQGITFRDGSGRLDIRILNDDWRFICAIENKVWSPESGSQLEFYREALDSHYPEHRVERIFLTPAGAVPENPEEERHWITMTYKDILGLVELTLENRGNGVHEDIRAPLRQYATTIRRNIVPEVSDDVHRLARQIYRKHKQAIDLIIEYRERYEPDYPGEAYGMVRDAVRNRPEWRESTCNRNYARFVAAEWADREELKVDGWPNILLQFQVRCANRHAELSLFITWRGDGKLKSSILDRLSVHPELFDNEIPEDANDSIDLRIGNVLEESDYDAWWNEDGTREKIAQRLDDFARGQFPDINKIVLDCLEQHRAGVK